ncbi:MAG: L-ribulose-5-phosphate 4-epimerase [Firmicutes bacterium]|nr:L-ribulose-5-phosphate 4-epimerase [Bacillota bacterium]
MLEELKKIVWEANLLLQKNGLVLYTWGNVSGIEREKGLVVIKPSGVEYDQMKPEDMVVVDLYGKQVDGELKPSSDTPTHLAIYRHFSAVGGIVHTHSTYATAWAQAERAIPVLGTTHADYFYGNVPCTRKMMDVEIKEHYEEQTGNLIVETFKALNPMEVPGVLVASHGPFAWGKDALEAVYHVTVLEEIAKTSLFTQQINSGVKNIDAALLDKHFLRKHGHNAYYGQSKS